MCSSDLTESLKHTRYNPKKKQATFYTDRALHPGDGLEIWNKKKHTGTGICKHYEKGETFTLQVEGWVDEGSPVYLSKNHELLKRLKKTYEKSVRKQPICGTVVAAIDEPVVLRLETKTYSSEVKGGMVVSATNRPFTEEDVRKQLMKLGNTPFTLENLDVVWPENAYMNIKDLNQLRREAVEQLEEKIAQQKQVEQVPYEVIHNQGMTAQKTYCVHVLNQEQLEVILGYAEVDAVYWEWQYDNVRAKEALACCLKHNKKCYLVLPSILKDKTWQQYKDDLLAWEETALTGYVVRNYGSFNLIQNSCKEKVVDYTLNSMNNESIAHWLLKGATRVTPSLELSRDELSTLTGPLEKIIYGHMPVMTTEQCILGNYKQCMKQKTPTSLYTLKDRKGVSWPLATDCKGCKMQVLMDKPLYLDPRRDVAQLPFSSYRIVFTHEKGKEVAQVLNALFKEEVLTKETQLGIYFKPIE